MSVLFAYDQRRAATGVREDIEVHVVSDPKLPLTDTRLRAFDTSPSQPEEPA